MKRKDLWSRLEIPNNLADMMTPLQSIVELLGNKRLLVENHRGVCAYRTEKIIINVSFGKLVVCGQNLMLTYMAKNQIIITGLIFEICVINGE